MKRLLLGAAFVGMCGVFTIISSEMLHKEDHDNYEYEKQEFLCDLMVTNDVEMMENAFKRSFVESKDIICPYLFCMIRSKEMGDLFMRYGFDIRKESKSFLLHKGVSYNIITPVAIEYAAERGADIELQDETGKTVLAKQLHFCEHEFFVDNVKILLEYNASVECVDHEKNTPLHILCKKRIHTSDFLSYCACKNDMLKAAIYLVKCGADPCALNGHGLEPAELVDRRDILKMYLETEAQGAKVMRFLNLE